MELEFLKPHNAWLILIFVLVFLFWLGLRKKNYISSTTIKWLDPVLLRPSLIRRLPGLMLTLAIALLILSLMDPVLPMSQQQVQSQGLDIAIVLDLSESMQEVMDRENLPQQESPALEDLTMSMTPVGTTRLETTKHALRDFINRRKDDRIALVVFADNAYIVSPLTLDHDYLLHYLDTVDEKILGNERMTAVGDGILLANSLLARQRDIENRGQVIMTFTDGEYNFGRDPLEVLSYTYLSGVKVHLVGVDLEQRLREKENVQKLISTVTNNGGRFFDANTEDDLLAASDEINTMEKGHVITLEYIQQVPVYHWFVVPSAILIGLAFGLRMLPYFSNYT